MRRLFGFCLVVGSVLTGCEKPIDTNRTVEPYGTFGEVIYREACQRVAYIGQREQWLAGLIPTLDVSGQFGRSVCVDGNPPPAGSPPKLPALVAQKGALVQLVDTILPKDFLDTLEKFLEQLAPPSDDGTRQNAIARLGETLGVMAADDQFNAALERLSKRNGYRPTKTAAGLVHTVVYYPGIDDFIGQTLGLIAKGGA